MSEEEEVPPQLEHMSKDFFLKLVQVSRKAAKQNPKHDTVSIEPLRADFVNYIPLKICVMKFVLKNNCRIPRRFFIQQYPQDKQKFQLKGRRFDIPPRKTATLYLIFSPVVEYTKIEDSFTLKIQGQPEAVRIPIVCEFRPYIKYKQLASSIDPEQNDDDGLQQQVKNILVRPRKQLGRKAQVRKSDFQLLRQHATIFFHEHFKSIARGKSKRRVVNDQAIGEDEIHPARQQQILNYWIKVKKLANEALYQKIKNRLYVEIFEEGPLNYWFKYQTFQWDFSKNLKIKKQTKAIDKLQQQVSKLVISIRFKKIFDYVKIFQDYSHRAEYNKQPFQIQNYFDFLYRRIQNKRKKRRSLDFDFDKSFSLKRQNLPIDIYRGAMELIFYERFSNFYIMQFFGFDHWMFLKNNVDHDSDIFMCPKHDILIDYSNYPRTKKRNLKGYFFELPLQIAPHPLFNYKDFFQLKFAPKKIDLGLPVQSICTSINKYYPQQLKNGQLQQGSGEWIDNYVEKYKKQQYWGQIDSDQWIYSYLKQHQEQSDLIFFRDDDEQERRPYNFYRKKDRESKKKKKQLEFIRNLQGDVNKKESLIQIRKSKPQRICQ